LKYVEQRPAGCEVRPAINDWPLPCLPAPVRPRAPVQLIAVEDAAIPVTVVSVGVLAREVRELPLIEEFTLRFVSRGVGTRD
jgi:hypothetical protein